jgi:hypothetical protein
MWWSAPLWRRATSATVSPERAGSDVGQVEAQALVVAGWNAPVAAGAFGSLQARQQRREAVLQLRLGEPHRVVMHHERAEGRHGLDHAGDGGLLQAMRQGEHQPAQGPVDPVAELHDQRGIAGGQKAGVGIGRHGAQ